MRGTNFLSLPSLNLESGEARVIVSFLRNF